MARFQDMPVEVLEKVLLLAMQETRGTTFAIDVGAFHAPNGPSGATSTSLMNWWDPKEPGREPVQRRSIADISRRLGLPSSHRALARWIVRQKNLSRERCAEIAYAIFQVFADMGPMSFRWYKRRPEDVFTLLRPRSPQISRRYYLGPLGRHHYPGASVHALVHSNAAELAFALMRTSKMMCWAMTRILDLHGRQIRASAWNMYPPARSQVRLLRATREGDAMNKLVFASPPSNGPQLPNFDIYGCEIWEARMRYLEASDMQRLGRRLWLFPHLRDSISQSSRQDGEESEDEEYGEIEKTRVYP